MQHYMKQQDLFATGPVLEEFVPITFYLLYYYLCLVLQWAVSLTKSTTKALKRTTGGELLHWNILIFSMKIKDDFCSQKPVFFRKKGENLASKQTDDARQICFLVKFYATQMCLPAEMAKFSPCLYMWILLKTQRHWELLETRLHIPEVADRHSFKGEMWSDPSSQQLCLLPCNMRMAEHVILGSDPYHVLLASAGGVWDYDPG